MKGFSNNLTIAEIARKLLQKKSSIAFLAINIFAAILGFGRSFVFMKFLDFQELGLITVIQTGAMFIGFFQIGLINGGYRILALKKIELSDKINNVLFSFFLILFVFLLTISIFFSLTEFYHDLAVVWFIFLLGNSLLIFNWCKNVLIARGSFRLYNSANLSSSIIGFVFLPLAYYFGSFGGALVILLQPICYIIFVYIKEPKLRPNKFFINKAEVKFILHYGFIPFMSGIFILVQIQLERWGVTAFLGTESLGKLFLFFVTISIWTLVPNSINNLIFPKGVLLFENRDIFQFLNIIRKHFLIVSIYSLISIIVVIYFLKPMVRIFFIEHLPYSKLVVMAIPGLVFRVLSGPLTVFFNSTVKLRPILLSDIFGLIIYVLTIILFLRFKILDLEHFIVAFNVYFTSKFLLMLRSYLVLRKKLVVSEIKN